jgi:predicted TIM-barrel fold metal-dependent hydrolase
VIDHLVGAIGCDRILYGSGMPRYTPQASMNAIFQADLSTAERAQILAGNALRLFGLDDTAMQPQDKAAGFRGYAGPKIDVRAHLHAGNYRFPIAAASPDVVLDHCRRNSIDIVLASSARGIFYDMETGNRELKTIIDAHPQFRGYVVTNPNLLEESCAEMDTYYRYPNFVGAKIHCEYSNQPTAGPHMQALVAEGVRRGRPVKIHTSGSGWAEAIRALALAHPQLAIIIAPGGPPGTGRIVADVPTYIANFAAARRHAVSLRTRSRPWGRNASCLGSARISSIHASSWASTMMPASSRSRSG